MVVVSALAGVTDALLDIAAHAVRGNEDAVRAGAAQLHERHAAAARALLSGAQRSKEVLRLIDEAFAELEQIASGLVIVRELTPRTSDYLVGRGERLSAQLVAAGLEEAGCPVALLDALEVIKSDATFGHASPNLTLTDRAAKKTLGPLLARGVVAVVPGFMAATPDGQLATLGRGGSDLTATLLGRALGAREVSLWKDVPGMLTADPRVVPDARVIPQLHQREAAELAYYGAKVLHPRALIPIGGRSLAIRIRPFADPGARGTEISRRRTLRTHPVKALSAVSGQALITVTGNGMLGIPGIAARTFAAVHQQGVSVSLISQASSEHSICFSVPEASAERARTGLLQAFRDEIERREIDGVEIQRGVATFAVVGLGMAGTPGIAAKIFTALASGEINVIAIAQGSSELNLSVVVGAKEVVRAQRLVHAAFQLDKLGGGAVTHAERTDVVLLGFGQIGRVLAAMIAKLKRVPVELKVVGLVDRSGYVFDAAGLSPRRLAALAAGKGKGVSLAKAAGGRRGTADEAVDFVARHALSNPVLVDVTADDTSATLKRALTSGMHLVLANKRPLTAHRKLYDELTALAAERDRRLLHETTVGLPARSASCSVSWAAGGAFPRRCGAPSRRATPSPIRATISREPTSPARRSSSAGCLAFRARWRTSRSSRSSPSPQSGWRWKSSCAGSRSTTRRGKNACRTRASTAACCGIGAPSRRGASGSAWWWWTRRARSRRSTAPTTSSSSRRVATRRIPS